MRFKGVFFDFDYTLGDGTEAILAGFRYAFSEMGLPVPEDEAVRRTVGMVLEDEYTLLSGDASPEGRETFRRLYTELAGPMQVERTRLFPGARELLEALKAAGVPAGVVSTKRYETLREILQARGVTPLLSSISGGGQGLPPKPTRRACSPPSGPRAWRRGRSSTAGTRLSTRRRPSGAAYPSARCSTAPPARRTSAPPASPLRVSPRTCGT